MNEADRASVESDLIDQRKARDRLVNTEALPGMEQVRRKRVLMFDMEIARLERLLSERTG